MCSHDQGGPCGAVPGFSLAEKILFQGAFYLGLAMGFLGLWAAGPLWALGWLACAVAGFTLLVRYTVCARCPHLSRAGDCLFLPPSLVRRLAAPGRAGALNWVEKGIFFGAFGVTVLGPVPWLVHRPAYLAVYVLLWSAFLAGMLLKVCRKCAVTACPLNRCR